MPVIRIGSNGIKPGSTYQNPYDEPANAIDRQFFSPNDPIGAFNYYGDEFTKGDLEAKSNPIDQIKTDFQEAQARQAQPRSRKAAQATGDYPAAPVVPGPDGF